MPTDPNAGLIKAVTGLTRALEDNTKASKELTKELKARPRTVPVAGTPYLERTGDDYVGPYDSGPARATADLYLKEK